MKYAQRQHATSKGINTSSGTQLHHEHVHLSSAAVLRTLRLVLLLLTHAPLLSGLHATKVLLLVPVRCTLSRDVAVREATLFNSRKKNGDTR